MLQQFRIVWPNADGTRIPASLINSKDSSIRIISTIIGNGIFSLALTIASNNSVGRNSSWKIVTEIYIAGSKIAIKKAIERIIFSRLENILFKLMSSVEIRKSSSNAGTIRAKGEPSIKIATLPANIKLLVLSGLSVAITSG